MRKQIEIEARIKAIDAEIESYETTKAVKELACRLEEVEACDNLIDKAKERRTELDWVLEYIIH